MRIVSARNFRHDPMFRRIERVVADLLAEGNAVTPVDVLIGMRRAPLIRLKAARARLAILYLLRVDGDAPGVTGVYA
jgi:hypothetical protein